MKRNGLLLFLAMTALISVQAAKADYVYYPPGCYICKDRNTLLGYYQDCTQVKSGERGDGIYCTEYDSLLVRYCSTSGGICEYIEVGGGGSGFGGRGGTCGTTRGYCPPECFQCGPQLF